MELPQIKEFPLRRTALALALTAAVIVPTVSTIAPAFAADGKTETRHHTNKPAKVVFAATGTITAVDTAAGTVTVAARHGSKDVRGKTLTVAVGSTTRIWVGGARKALADLAAGYRITVVGVRQDTTYTATGIEAREVAKKTPSDDATPVPSSSDSRGS
jgi:hypothetical protein